MVLKVFVNRDFLTVLDEVEAAKKAALRLKAMQTLEDCLNDEKGSVRIRAALAIAADAGTIKAAPTTIKDNKIVLVWGKDGKKHGMRLGKETVIDAE